MGRRPTRTSMAMANKDKNNHKKMEFLSTDSMVEVRSEEEGFRGAWYAAKILNNSISNPKDKILVEYQRFIQPLTECVDISFIRPLPPPPAADQTYKPHDVVDAFRHDGWWKGVVSKVEVLEGKTKSKRYVVVFENPPEQLHFSPEDLRFHLIWTDGKWVHPPKQEIPDIADCEEQSAHVDNTASNSKLAFTFMSRKNLLEQPNPLVAASRSKKPNKPAPETEILPNYSKKFRKENSVVSLSDEEACAASMLLNSTEKVAESALAKCSMHDLGANLPLNKGKNTSHNRREAGLENRMAELSKKRERELDAQVTVQQVAAAESELVKEQEMPFTKSSSYWQYVDSLEVFRFLPQKPHFSLLSGCNEETREGIALGCMLTFATLVEKVSKLQIEKPISLFDSYLEALADLEMQGFDVKAVVDCISQLLSFKRRQEQLDNRSKEFDRKIAECDGEKAKLEEEINAIDKMISELKEQRATKVSQKVKEDSKSDFLRFNASTITDDMLFVKEKFKVRTAAIGRCL